MSKVYVGTCWPKVIQNIESVLEKTGWTKGQWNVHNGKLFWSKMTPHVTYHLYISEHFPHINILSKAKDEDRVENQSFYIQEFSFEQPSHHHYWPHSIKSDDEWEAAVLRHLTEIK